VRVDAEVDALDGPRRLGDPVGDRRLNDDVLVVAGARVEDQRQLAIVDGRLAQNGGERAEPERAGDAFVHNPAVLRVADIAGRCSAQVSKEWIRLDVGHSDFSLSSIRR
jgi:hypothetical protein